MAVLTDHSTGDMALQCDHCSHTTDSYSLGEPGAFQHMIDEAKAEGWKIERDHKADEGWSHTCPSHTGKNRVEEQRKLLGL